MVNASPFATPIDLELLYRLPALTADMLTDDAPAEVSAGDDMTGEDYWNQDTQDTGSTTTEKEATKEEVPEVPAISEGNEGNKQEGQEYCLQCDDYTFGLTLLNHINDLLQDTASPNYLNERIQYYMENVYKPRPVYRWLRPQGAGDLKREASAANREWVLDRYVAAGSVTIFAAYPKTGKSTFLWPLIVAVSQGKPFMGWPTKQTPVLVLSEEPGDILQGRLEALGCVENDPNLMVHTLPCAIDDNGLAEIGAWMEETRGLLVIDTVSEYAGIEEDSNNNEIGRKLQPLKRLAREHKGTVMYVHHDRKNGEDSDEGKTIRGGGAYLAIVDQAYMLKRKGGVGSTQRVIVSIGRYREIPDRIEVEWDGKVGFDLVTSSADANNGPAKTVAEVRLWKALPVAPAPGLTKQELAEQTGIHIKTVALIMESWEKGDSLISTGAGHKGDPGRWSRKG